MGTGPERLLKQQKVLSSLLAIAGQVTDMVRRRRESYLASIMEDNVSDTSTIWPCLNEQHLGNLSTGEFFAELAVVPVAGRDANSGGPGGPPGPLDLAIV